MGVIEPGAESGSLCIFLRRGSKTWAELSRIWDPKAEQLWIEIDADD